MALLLSTRRFAGRRGFRRSVPTAAPPPDLCATASRLARFRSRLRRLGRDEQGSSAIEFALLCAPFVFMLLYALQIGIFYMTQTALDTGVVRQADALQRGFNTVPSPASPSAASLKSTVASGSGALVATDSTLLVELRQLKDLSSATVPITGGVADYGDETTKTSVLVLRAQSPVLALGPGFSALQKVTSTAIVRRQGR